MDATSRIEQALNAALSRATSGPSCPPRLAAAMHHSVFPRGARVRPRLCLAVAAACGDDDPTITDIAATSIELLHSASLVHDDLPCFDDAATRNAERSQGLRRASRRACGRRTDCAGIPESRAHRLQRAAHERAAVDYLAISRHPVGNCCRSGVGMRAACRSGELSSRKNRFAVFRSDLRWRCRCRWRSRSLAVARRNVG